MERIAAAEVNKPAARASADAKGSTSKSEPFDDRDAGRNAADEESDRSRS